MGLHVHHNGELADDLNIPEVGEVIDAGIVMKVGEISVMEFIQMALGGFKVDTLGFDQVVILEDFVSSSKDHDGIAEIIGGRVVLIWVNHL
jgi:hypothetical protein